MQVIAILIGVGLACFCGYQIYLLIRDIKNKKQKNIDKGDNSK